MITVTNRPGSIDVTWGALQRQSVQDFEWILCDELHDWRSQEVAAYVDDARLQHIPAPVVEGHLWNLNKSYNEALRHCRGELVVSLQDYIWIPPTGLERFWSLYCSRGPLVFVSGVGHAYDPPQVHNAKGKISIFASPYDPDDHTDTVWMRTGTDARFTARCGTVACRPDHWELNWGAAPLEAFYELGGFPEDHDRQFVSCDNLSIAYGAERRGYTFLLDYSNACHLFDHRRAFVRADWEGRHGKNGRWERWFREWSARGCPRFPHLSGPLMVDPSTPESAGQPKQDEVHRAEAPGEECEDEVTPRQG